MARRHHNNSISLFPFLAVLVCAMGSLILLLLVMTRKMRQDQYVEQTAVVESAASEVDAELAARIAALEKQISSAELNLHSLQANAQAHRSSVDESQVRVTDLETELAQLQEKLKGTDADAVPVAESMAESRKLKAEEVALLRQLKDTEKRLLSKQQQLANAQDASNEASLALQEKHSDLLKLRDQVDEARSRLAKVSGTSTLLEFSNPTGTERTPIVVDVSGKGFEIYPNGIQITQADMEGFPVRDNPFLAAILTIHQHRSKGSVTGAPYVLLLVRPDGALPFYGAQRILMESNIHYGYELLEARELIVSGASDSTEVPLVKTSIDEALRRRENLYARLMAIAQQKSGTSGPAGDPANGKGERRLTVRPDGRVLMEESSRQRPVDGRFYAGGVAPPQSHFQKRPVGGYGGQNADQMTAADAEKLADEFAERYARQYESARALAKTTIAEEGPKTAEKPVSATTESEESLRSPEERRFAETLFANDGSITSSLAQKQKKSDLAKSATTKSDPLSPQESLLTSSGAGDDQPATGIPDLSRIDPDLLNRLNSGKQPSGSEMTPIGITVFVDEHHMTVDQQTAVEITPDTLDDAFVLLLTGINAEVEDRKKKPDEPVMPIVKFIVSPGGEKWRIPLAHSLKRTGIRSATVYELTPYMTTTDETGRAWVSGEGE
ncbi:MAG: hypothetical protein NT138_12420 [Planctomycetales bacterium]|jgi:hypothetical protein|nr:hypothetical protein [Planctomycetales bacterium]